jgi:hypothetical protein
MVVIVVMVVVVMVVMLHLLLLLLQISRSPPTPAPRVTVERKFIFMYRENRMANISFLGKQNSTAKFFSAKTLMKVRKNICLC